MRYFTERCLIIMPEIESYEELEAISKKRLDKAVNATLDYITRCGIVPYCFDIDEYAITKIGKKVVYYSALCKEDRIFVTGRGMVLGELPEDYEVNAASEKIARTKFPVARGTSYEIREKIVLNRVKLITNDVIKSFRFVITFENRNKEKFKVRGSRLCDGVEDDGRVVWRLRNNMTFEAFLSGRPAIIRNLTAYNDSRLPIYEWNMEEAINDIR